MSTSNPSPNSIVKSSGANSAFSSQARDWRRLSSLLEKLPPHAIEAEMSLLGSILIEPRIISETAMIVRNGDDFYRPANGAIYDIMLASYDTHSSLDLVQLNQALVDRGILDDVGGQDYLVELAESVPSAAHAMHYARLVREKANIRQIIAAAGDILYEAYENPGDARRILDEAENRIFAIAQRYEQSDIESVARLVQQVITTLENSEGREVTGVLSGFYELDEMTGGFQPGDFIILAARPSMGKTAFVLNVAENIGMRGEPVGIFSLEMSKHQLVHRLLAARSGLDVSRLRRMMLGKEHYSRLYAACGDLQKAEIYIDDMAGATLLQIRSRARRMALKHGVKAILIDYIQLISLGMRTESRQVEVSEISRGLKALARELNVPVIALSQLNRAAETRDGHRPRLSDLRESGSLEQDADVVGLLHREDYYHQKTDPSYVPTNTAELIIAKQRNGPTGLVEMLWDPSSTKFKNLTRSAAPQSSTSHAVPQRAVEPKPSQSFAPPAADVSSHSAPLDDFDDMPPF